MSGYEFIIQNNELKLIKINFQSIVKEVNNIS